MREKLASGIMASALMLAGCGVHVTMDRDGGVRRDLVIPLSQTEGPDFERRYWEKVETQHRRRHESEKYRLSTLAQVRRFQVLTLQLRDQPITCCDSWDWRTVPEGMMR